MYKRSITALGLVLFALLAIAAFAPQANAGAPAHPEAQMGNFPALYYNYIDAGGTDCPTGNAVYQGYDNEIFKYWPENTSPVPGIVNTNNYMVCWNGSVYFPQAGTYGLYALTDDGMNIWINGAIAMNAWYDQGPTWHQGTFTIPAAGSYSFQVKYYNRPNAGTACVSWALQGQQYPWQCPYPPGPPVPPYPPIYPTPNPCQYPPNCNNPYPPPPCQYPPNCNNPYPPQPPCQYPPNCNNPYPPCQYQPNCNNPYPPKPIPKPPVTTCWYRIQYGDNLYSIAYRFHVSVWQLEQWNNISDPNLIYAGLVIKVCGGY